MMKPVQRLTVLLILVVACFSVFPNTKADEETSLQNNKETLIAFHEAEANRDYDAFANYIAEDFVRHSVATTAIMPEMMVNNRAEYITFLQDTATTFPDYVTTPEILIAEGDYVAFYSMFTGTFVANGNYLSVPVSGIARFEDGLIAEMWVEWDNLTWDMQMNAVESPVESFADLVGVWESVFDNGSYRVEYSGDNAISVGLNSRNPDNIGTGTIEIDGNRYVEVMEPWDCEGIYDVFATRQANGEVRSLRFELVEDCVERRIEALTTEPHYPYMED